MLALALLRGGSNPWSRLVAAAVYAVNPAIVFNTAFWGQHDAVWIAFVVWSLIALREGRVVMSWSVLALALLTKPQAWAFAPLLVCLGAARSSRRQVMAATGAALSAVFLVSLPFVFHGTLWASLEAIFRSSFGGEPFVSCNAANLWWLVTGGRGYEFRDTLPLVGPFTPRALGLAAYAAVCALVVRGLSRGELRPDRLFFGASLVARGVVNFATELHENHMVAVVPLLCFAVGSDRRTWGLLVAASLTTLANMSLFDAAVTTPLAGLSGASALPIGPLSVGVAATNVGLFVGLTSLASASLRPPCPALDGRGARTIEHPNEPTI